MHFYHQVSTVYRPEKDNLYCINWDSADLEVFMVEQSQCWVTELRVLPLPAVLLQEKRWVFLEFVHFLECVVHKEGQTLSLARQGIVGLIEGEARGGERDRSARRVGGSQFTFL